MLMKEGPAFVDGAIAILAKALILENELLSSSYGIHRVVFAV
jgi:hypothetical protein